MTVKIEHYLIQMYRPWGGAKEVYKRMTDQELDLIEDWFESFDTAFEEIEINDFFWFQDEQWLELLQTNEDDFWKREEQRQLERLEYPF